MRSFMIPLAVALAMLPGVLPQRSAEAHPHVWIDTRVTLRFDEHQRLTALVTEWVFDEIYTSFVVGDLDKAEDGGVPAEELQPLADQNVEELADWGYFTVLKADDLRLELGPAEEARMRYSEGRLVLSFVLPLAEPVDPLGREIAFSIFDPTFYIEIVPAEETPVRLEGAVPKGCAAKLRPFETTEERFVPDSLALSVQIDPSDPENGIGARFAEWIDLTCHKSS